MTIVRCLLATVLIGWAADSYAQPRWGQAAFASEKERTAQGCAAKFTSDSYFCIYVRCEAPNVLGLYFANPGPGMPSPFRISIDGREHMITMSIKPNETDLPYAERVLNPSVAMMNDLRSGKELRILEKTFKRGFDRVSLLGAGPAIERVARSCNVEKP